MEKESVKDNALSMGVLLEDIRKQGCSEVSKPVFYLICGVVSFSLVAVVALLSHYGVEVIEATLSVGQWLIGLLLLSLLIGWAAKHFLKMCLELWRMTKED